LSSSKFEKNSIYKFKQYFSFKETKNIVTKHYCTTCNREYHVIENINDICLLCPKQKNSYFVKILVIEHLREMLNRNGFYNNLHQKHINESNRCEPGAQLYQK